MVPAVAAWLLLLSAQASAHVVVTPHQVGIAAVQEFSMSVPTEKDNPTIGIKLFMPAGLSDVLPNVAPGWTISEQKSGDNVTEIDWTGGAIPPDQRQDFLFQAQVPATATTLKWKTYQYYQDGSIVKWINTPTANPEDDSAPPPYSTTMVINDLSGSGQSSASSNSTAALTISIVALVLSVGGLAFQAAKRR